MTKTELEQQMVFFSKLVVKYVMCKITRRAAQKYYSAKLGPVVAKEYKHTGVITKWPDRSKVILSPAQKNENSRFKQAVAFAKEVKLNPDGYIELIKSFPKGKSIYHAAIAAFMKGAMYTS